MLLIGYIRAEELAETRALCQTALRDVRAYAKTVQKVYVLSNSDFIVGRTHFPKNPDFLQLAVFWKWSFEAWKNATPEELRKIRFIMPWQPPDQTKAGYVYMRTMIKRQLEDIHFWTYFGLDDPPKRHGVQRKGKIGVCHWRGW